MNVVLRPLRRTLQLQRCTSRKFTVLALESSADDTCAAVVTSDKEILSNVVIRQHHLNEVYGGIHPYAAINAHQRNMPVAVGRALDEAKLGISQIDGIAFTRGPGIGGCLSVSSNAAKTLAASLKKPLVGVHHMQAHALTALLAPGYPPPKTPVTYPFLTLLVSGGHTLLVLTASPTRFRILATTLDEAVGRVIDKVARALDLRWGSRGLGSALEDFCSSEPTQEETEETLSDDICKDAQVPQFARVMPGRLAFSFSGLHSQVDRILTEYKDKKPPESVRRAIARAFQDAVFSQLADKVVLALKWCSSNGSSEKIGELVDQFGTNFKIKHVVVSGGVASNALLRSRLATCLKETFPEDDISLAFPPPELCTDNAVMIAWASMHRFLANDTDDYSIEHRAKWSIEDLDT